jgi:hypothetical protein
VVSQWTDAGDDVCGRTGGFVADLRNVAGGAGAEDEVRRTHGVLPPDQARTLLPSFYRDDEVYQSAAAWEEMDLTGPPQVAILHSWR